MATIREFWLIAALRWAGRTLLAGLGAILPLAVTLYILGWLLITAEQVVAAMIKAVLPAGPEGGEPYYIPGMGIASVVLLLLIIGVSLRSYIMRRAVEWEDRVLRRIPLVRTLYSSIRDIAHYLGNHRNEQLGKPVLVTWPGTSVQMLGFITQEDTRGLNGYQLVEDPVLVYLPMSYQIGGYTVIVPRSTLQPLDLPFDRAMSFIFMAGMRRIDESGDNNASTPTGQHTGEAQVPR